MSLVRPLRGRLVIVGPFVRGYALLRPRLFIFSHFVAGTSPNPGEKYPDSTESYTEGAKHSLL
ncbi:MAG: hypothetical protein IPF68_03200 [Bacteroidales bacterium]|nr:hypothetical protein [Bacteroidales bacterium]